MLNEIDPPILPGLVSGRVNLLAALANHAFAACKKERLNPKVELHFIYVKQPQDMVG